MSSNVDKNWWEFSTDSTIRRDTEKSRLTGELAVNPELPGGRRLLEYGTYLGLSELLGCQRPSSRSPDERPFITVHQMFELAFKEMIFDLAVIAETFDHLLGITDEREFLWVSAKDEDFWGPALTASARVKLYSNTLLPSFMKILGNESEDETFSGIEFYYFRNNLSPASGFQTAQYRLIQRAFGKSPLLKVRLFPGEDYRWHYEGLVSREESRKYPEGLVSRSEPVRVVDELILRKAAAVASPQGDSPLAHVAEVDALAHKILRRLPSPAAPGESEPQLSAIKKISSCDIGRAIDSLRRILAHRRREQEKAGKKPSEAAETDEKMLEVFQGDLTNVACKENARRDSLKRARLGAFFLHYIAPESCLARVLDRLRTADSALHGVHHESFLSVHYRVAKNRLRQVMQHAAKVGAPKPPSGTGGGGIEYLAFARNHLLPLFPALIAYVDLEDSPTWSWIE
jgi:tryptophan 2,3-dioxygenase